MQKPHKLIVKPDVVVADKYRIWLNDFVIKQLEKLGLTQTVGNSLLRRNARDQDRVWLGQNIWRQLKVDVDGLADGLKLKISTLPGKLHDTRPPRIKTCRLQIIKEKTGSHDSYQFTTLLVGLADTINVPEGFDGWLDYGFRLLFSFFTSQTCQNTSTQVFTLQVNFKRNLNFTADY